MLDKNKISYYKAILKEVWNRVIIVVLYVIAMWSLLVAAVFLFTKDLLQAAGIVSAIVLFRLVQAEFNKEFFGARNPEVKNAVQKQSKR